ncbi:MAG TPA: GNAT family N-acetyltransferase [Gammaproteobacteria bacterium]|nr:GNAT family N-acetyltransferase [Gammaproteobacteria bacterium]
MSTRTADEWTETLRDGSRVRIRAIRPEDAAAQSAFIDGLSAESRRLLFLGGIAHLRDEELRRLCSPDCVRDMAYVAIAPGTDGEHIGVSRYASERPACEEAEISVAVADAWQHRGLATLLLRRLIDHARTHGIKRLYSMDAAANERMRRLARRVGFTEEPDPKDVHQVIYSLRLDEPSDGGRK